MCAKRVDLNGLSLWMYKFERCVVVVDLNFSWEQVVGICCFVCDGCCCPFSKFFVVMDIKVSEEHAVRIYVLILDGDCFTFSRGTVLMVVHVGWE